jgi:hypothetical protein
VALNDSPIGLAAYILEKFITWTNPAWKNLEDGGLTKKYTYTDLLDNVMIYWVTNSITTSMRLYSETLNKAQTKLGISKYDTNYVFCYRSNILFYSILVNNRLYTPPNEGINSYLCTKGVTTMITPGER